MCKFVGLNIINLKRVINVTHVVKYLESRERLRFFFVFFSSTSQFCDTAIKEQVSVL